MVDGLNDHRIEDTGEYFRGDFRRMENSGRGLKNGLRELQDIWRRPFQAAFSEKACIDEARLFLGEWAAASGRREAVHSGEFFGVQPAGKRAEIRYMDFWKVVGGKIAGNWVVADFPHALAQLGIDVFEGNGWEARDRGEERPSSPASETGADE